MAPIRLAVAADVLSIEAIVQRAYRPYVTSLGLTPAPLEDDYHKRVASGEAYVTIDGHRVAGVLIIERASDHLRIENVAVDPGVERRGFGRALVAFAESLAASWDLRDVRLYTNVAMVANIAWYGRLGYRETHRARIGDRERVFMRKRLPCRKP
ncbi:MAG: GNAT family N-acetyltransferase [Vulcanimicrobiaceae bacterium]